MILSGGDDDFLFSCFFLALLLLFSCFSLRFLAFSLLFPAFAFLRFLLFPLVDRGRWVSISPGQRVDLRIIDLA